jgi:hypothetical protein
MGSLGTQSIWKAGARLADGREIAYFDEALGLERAVYHDTRPLPPRPPGPTRSHEQSIQWDSPTSRDLRVLGADNWAFTQARSALARASGSVASADRLQ